MKFGVREICDVVFKAKSKVTIGNTTFEKGAPVLYIDTAKASTIEGAASTTYATGGRGNARLIAWEGEKTLTFTVEDALLSPMGFAILSGAGLLQQNSGTKKVYVHTTAYAYADAEGSIDLTDALSGEETVSDQHCYVVPVSEDGSFAGAPVLYETSESAGEGKTVLMAVNSDEEIMSKNVFVDFYVEKNATDVAELQIDAANFAGYYYVEASTLFRRQADGVDLPAEITFPNVKIQSNFTFAMAATGDPSTFTFTMDALPGYTTFNSKKKVLCAMQIIDDEVKVARDNNSVFEVAVDEA